jgi:hypothetical protein
MRIDPPDPSPEVEDLKAGLAALAEKLKVGDVTPKRYAKARQDQLARLGRAKIAPRLTANEAVIAEHHWVEGHSKIPDSVLKETAQIAGSLYATDRRLFLWRFQDQGVPGAAFLEGAEEILEERWYGDVESLEPGRAWRWGEVTAGAVIAVVALVLAGHLRITTYFLLAIGLFGVLHGLLSPTRWVAVASRTPGEKPWAVWAARTKSGRELLREVEARTRSERR